MFAGSPTEIFSGSPTETFEGEKQAYCCWLLNKDIHCMFVEGKPRHSIRGIYCNSWKSITYALGEHDPGSAQDWRMSDDFFSPVCVVHIEWHVCDICMPYITHVHLHDMYDILRVGCVWLNIYGSVSDDFDNFAAGIIGQHKSTEVVKIFWFSHTCLLL